MLARAVDLDCCISLWIRERARLTCTVRRLAERPFRGAKSDFIPVILSVAQRSRRIPLRYLKGYITGSLGCARDDELQKPSRIRLLVLSALFWFPIRGDFS